MVKAENCRAEQLLPYDFANTDQKLLNKIMKLKYKRNVMMNPIDLQYDIRLKKQEKEEEGEKEKPEAIIQ